MKATTVAGLLADPVRLRVFSAIALGADNLAEVATTAGVPVKEAAGAVRRLQGGGLVQEEAGKLGIDLLALRDLAREAEPTTPEVEPSSGDQQVDALLRTFTRDGRLVRMPAQLGRRRTVLEYLTDRSFAAGVRYDEKSVNEILRGWCEGPEVDHVTIRRYLVDLGLLRRDQGVYQLPERSTVDTD